MKISQIIYLVIFCLLFSCKTTITSNLECNIDFGIDEINLGEIHINYLKKESKSKFYYYQYIVERCPGNLSNNCKVYYSFYSDNIPKLKNSIKESKNCFSLYMGQKYVLPVTDYNKFVKNLPDTPIKTELLNKLNDNIKTEAYNKEIVKIDQHKKSKLFRIGINSTSVYEFEINTEQLNYYFRPSGGIYTYSAYPEEKTIVLLIIPDR